MIAKPTPCVMSCQAEISCSIAWHGHGEGIFPIASRPQQPKELASIIAERASRLVGSLMQIGAFLITVLRIVSQKPSLTSLPSITRYCSKVCDMMSAAPAAVCHAGTLALTDGSQKEAFGKSNGEDIACFSLVSILLITPGASYSLPVAASVSTEKSGRASLIRLPSLTRSQASPSYLTAAAIALEASITEPPPTATIKSAFCSRASLAAALTEVTRGLGSMPENSTTSKPVSAFLTRSSKPLRTTLPPP